MSSFLWFSTVQGQRAKPIEIERKSFFLQKDICNQLVRKRGRHLEGLHCFTGLSLALERAKSYYATSCSLSRYSACGFTEVTLIMDLGI